MLSQLQLQICTLYNITNELLPNLLPLFIPLLNPSIGADCLEVLGKELARLILLALCGYRYFFEVLLAF